MAKIRVHELAKELNRENKEIIQALLKNGVEVKSLSLIHISLRLQCVAAYRQSLQPAVLRNCSIILLVDCDLSDLLSTLAKRYPSEIVGCDLSVAVCLIQLPAICDQHADRNRHLVYLSLIHILNFSNTRPHS